MDDYKQFNTIATTTTAASGRRPARPQSGFAGATKRVGILKQKSSLATSCNQSLRGSMARASSAIGRYSKGN